MGRSYERTIRWKAIGIYMFIAVICLAVSLYIYNLSRNVSNQKQHIENYYDLLRMTNRVTFSVSDAQSTANLYLTSKNPTHLVSFRRQVAETELQIDSLTYLSRITGDTSNLESLKEMGSLLRRKGDIIHNLNTRLVSYNPVDSIADRLFIYDSPAPVNDSVFLLGGRKDFWDVISNAFVPPTYRDSLISAYQLRPDTVQTVRDDSIKIDAGVRQYVEQVRTGYSTNIREVERQINRLMRTDQEISAQIIEVLNSFHRRTMASTLRSIENSEEVIQRNYRYSLAGIVISLVPITVLVILIISDANKGHSGRVALERANMRIREIMASRHKLLLSASHDIKTPLGAILGYLELWKERGATYTDEIAAAQLSGKHINALVNNLLEFSGLQQGISKPSLQPFDLAAFCGETAGMVRPLAQKKGLRFETAFDIPDGLSVEADPMRLRQIILNILSNAVKYTSQGKVSFKARYRAGSINTVISDTGSGMTPQELEKIFRPFSRLDSNRSMAEGHGYGMYVVQGLVKLLGGEISIDSAPQQGTTVSITVPARAVSGEGASPAKVPVRNILFVDDDTVLLQVLSSMSATLGHRTDVCADPSAILSGQKDVTGYDMILTDMEMGRHTGAEVLRAVKQRNPRTPVVIMTGHSDMNADRARAMGFDGYLAKPVTMQTLENITGSAKAAPDAAKDASFSLAEMFGDEEILKEITETFVRATTEDMRTLRSALFRRDHRKVREVCHRLLPLYRQFGAAECVEVLLRIHASKPERAATKEYWKDVSLFIELGGEFIEKLKKEGNP